MPGGGRQRVVRSNVSPVSPSSLLEECCKLPKRDRERKAYVKHEVSSTAGEVPDNGLMSLSHISPLDGLVGGLFRSH